MTPKKTSESGWAIPDDWDALSWACYQIAWPDSPKYTVLLRSLFYSLTRGRDWDKFTGNVISAQVVGWDIFSRNTPLVDCTSAPDCPDCPPEPQNGISDGLWCLGECEMPCIDISNLLKIENGVLYARDACCVWVEIGKIAGTNEPVPDDPMNPEGDPEFVYYGCGKAKAIVDAVYYVIEATFDVISDPLVLPWQIVGKIEGLVGYDLDNSWLTLLIVNCAAAYALSQSYDDIASDVERANVLCALAASFDDNAVGVPDAATFEQIKGLFRANIGAANWVFWDQAINAIGRADMDTIAKLGAADSAATCECWVPLFGTDIDESGFDWIISLDFREVAPPVGSTYSGQSPLDPISLHYYAGKGIVSSISDVSGRNQIKLTMPILNAASIPDTVMTHVGVRWSCRALSEYKNQVTDHVTGTNGTTHAIQVGSVDSYPISAGGSFALNVAVNSDISADENFITQVDFIEVPIPWDDDDRAYSSVLEAVYFAGTGTPPVIYP